MLWVAYPWIECSLQVSGNGNGNRKLPPVFRELLGAGWIKRSVYNNVIVGQRAPSGQTFQRHAQDEAGPRSGRHPCDVSETRPTEVKEDEQTAPRGCCRPRPQDPFRGSCSSVNSGVPIGTLMKEKSVTPLNAHSDPERGRHCRAPRVKDQAKGQRRPPRGL